MIVDILNITQEKIVLTEKSSVGLLGVTGFFEVQQISSTSAGPNLVTSNISKAEDEEALISNVCSILSSSSPFLGISYFASIAETHLFQLSITVDYQIVAMMGEVLLL